MRYHLPGSLTVLAALLLLGACGDGIAEPTGAELDEDLQAILAQHGFSGTVQQELHARLGRPVNSELADLGRLLFFDRLLGLHSETDGSQGNSCSGCHTPATGFGDAQSIAIGVDNNFIAGPNRTGARNQRRSPMLVNTAFFPRLMWDGRFFAPSGDPFDNSQGFVFPNPEGTDAFPAGDPVVRHLLIAQAHIPPTELPEMAGFTGTSGFAAVGFVDRQRLPRRGLFLSSSPAPALTSTALFDDGHGVALPPPDENGFRNAAIRDMVADRINQVPAYRTRFAALFPAVATGGPIEYLMVAQALAEFQISLTFADAPIDAYARGDTSALAPAEKRGALVFFGKGRCASCHAVSGGSSEMFSDFRNHRIGGPPLAPVFGPGTGNVGFAGPGEDEDFGAEHSTGNAADRYAFRTAPLRNVSLQPTFFHNGAFTRLEDAIRHHLDAEQSLLAYDPARHNVAADLRMRQPPVAPILARGLSPLLPARGVLSEREFTDLLAFVRESLTDPRAAPQHLCTLVPATVPSGLPVGVHQGC